MQIYKIVLFSTFMFTLLNKTYATSSNWVVTKLEEDPDIVDEPSNNNSDSLSKLKYKTTELLHKVNINNTKTLANNIANRTKKALSNESAQKVKTGIKNAVNSTTNYVIQKSKGQEK
ncbi:uncharacterized protein LOC126895543 [Daktulosphaira vitifoliae]|uniref:uncharacterized protein LOC126895543 n=1 Tax=Daktulosphaira vitifoliae TaxID=58002 RepID=UPI0021AA3309|nr:uncharacterized protein LOC126895543 [Daktulosphaira vitifoliae]